VSVRLTFLAAIVAGLVIGGVVVGVRAFTGSSSNSRAADAVSTVTPTPAAGSPAAIAGEFAAAWAKGDTKSLYDLLSTQSQGALSYPAFARTYQSFSDATTVSNITVRVNSADNAHAVLAVRMETGYFGTLEYTTTLNLVSTPAGTRVDWSPSAVYPGLTEGQQFASDLQQPKRGAILDRNGNPLAIDQDVQMLGLNRAAVTDRAALSHAVESLGFDAAAVDAAFASGLGQNQLVEIGPVPSGSADAAPVVASQQPGLVLNDVTQRVHPLGAAAAQVVGYTRELTADDLAKRKGEGYAPGDRIGAMGIEAAENDVLAGKPGGKLEIVDDNGNTVKTVASRPFVQGQDVWTTLDSAVLKAAQAKLGSQPGASVVLDPRTNTILAINSSPSFDPDAFERGDAAAIQSVLNAKDGPLSNRATSGLYSSGSTFKLITAAAGLVYGGYTPESTLPCPPVWTGVGEPRKNWEPFDRGNLTIAEGLEHSCNPVFYQIGLTLYNTDPNDLSKMARLFGFGSPTGVKGIAEEGGLVPDPAWKQKNKGQQWFPGDSVNLAIGQGYLLITPLQLANAYSTFLAGELRTPVLLNGTQAKDEGALPLTAAQSATLKQGLKLVTGPNGTAASAFANLGYNDFLGKSGTAEDSGEQSHVDFVAAAPAETPTVLCTVFLDHGTSGSTQAGPIARDIVLAALAEGL
jgi:penicillin-binding protein 2